MNKTAIILFNLGGPSSLDEVRPFLFNLFKDPAILSIPSPFRYLLATFLAWSREEEAKKNYRILGGKSPLLENTQKQAQALEDSFSDENVKVFVSMRYAPPFFKDILAEISLFNPDTIFFLPLYPQFSTTTTASSFNEALKFLKTSPFFYQKKISLKGICCYPDLPEFIETLFMLSQGPLETVFKQKKPTKILFSAHGLPLSIVKKGDPYPEHLLRSYSLLEKRLKSTFDAPFFSYHICYQSKVGPLPWLRPSLEEMIKAAALEKKGVVIIPLSFVSEHSETLVELDVIYKNLGETLKLPFYIRIPAVSCHPLFIEGLKNLILERSSHSLFPCTCFSFFLENKIKISLLGKI